MALTFIEWLEQNNKLQEFYTTSGATPVGKPPTGRTLSNVAALASKVSTNPRFRGLDQRVQDAPSTDQAYQYASDLTNRGLNVLNPTQRKAAAPLLPSIKQKIAINAGVPPERIGAPKQLASAPSSNASNVSV